MLSVAKVGRAAGDYCMGAVAGGAEDHRPPGGEPDGVWVGKASEALGLRGRVTAAQLSSVLAGADPATGEVLNPAQDRVRVAAFDLVFAAPKSVSLCFALADTATSAQIRVAHESAVAAALGYLEREAICARRGRGDERFKMAVEGLLGAAFLHRTSRAPDPHLHTHVLVANLVAGIDGRWSAFDARGLYAHARTAGFLYQVHLRHEMSRRLGLEWGPVAKGMADIAGIDRSVLRAFSRRSQEIQAQLATEGRAGPRAARVAQLATRPRKQLDTSFEMLVAEWVARAETAGFGRSEMARATAGRWRRSPDPAVRFVGPAPGSPSEDRIRRMLGPEELTASASTFSRRDVIRAICSTLPDGAAVSTVEALADAVLSSALVLPVEDPVTRTPRTGARRIEEQRWTTPEVVAAERALVAAAMDRRSGEAGVVDPLMFESAVEDRICLPSCQLDAVERLLATNDGVVLATGARWAGCLDALGAARAGWESMGARVQAVASSAERAADFEALTGIETVTVADIVARLELAQLPGATGAAFSADILVLHDAGSLSLSTTKALLDGAERAGVKVVVVDEVRRLRAVEGGAFRRLGESLGVVALDAPRSTVSAVRIVGGGWTHAVEHDRECGAVVVGSSLPAVRQRLVADWWAERQAGRSPAMVASNRRELDSLNAGARAELIAAGQLGESMRVGRREIAVGDSVLISRGGREAGVATGTRATVQSVDAERQALGLLTEQGRSVSMSAKTAAAVEMRHAYAVTARDARKARPDQALILGEARAALGSAGNNRVYVVHGVGSRRPPGPELVNRRGSLGELGRRLDSLDQRLSRPVARDPTAALAHLDQEQARAAERLIAARSARSDAAARLEKLEGTRAWTGRRAARGDAQDVRAEVAFRRSEVGRWERRQELLADRRIELIGAGTSRVAGLASQEADRATRESLVEAVRFRQSVLARAAEVSPPAYLVAEIGPRPAAHDDRAAWRDAALAVESYRERWGVRDQSHALGERALWVLPGVESLQRRLQRDSAERQLELAQSRLRPELAAERSAERSAELAAEREVERSPARSPSLEPASRADAFLR